MTIAVDLGRKATKPTNNFIIMRSWQTSYLTLTTQYEAGTSLPLPTHHFIIMRSWQTSYLTLTTQY